MNKGVDPERTNSRNNSLLKYAGGAVVALAGLVGFWQGASEPPESHLNRNRPARIIRHQILPPHITTANIKPPVVVHHPREFYLVVRQHEPGTYSADAQGNVYFPQKVDAAIYNEFRNGQIITLADPAIQEHLPAPLSGDGQGVKGTS